MLKYTIAFIKRGEEILLLNRESSTWMGSWNGVGGKLEKNETPTECIIREIKEETNIDLERIEYKGTVTWDSDTANSGNGMYAFVVELPITYDYQSPIKTVEGILDWKKIDWILHPKNTGVANLPYFLPCMLESSRIYNHHFIYKNGDVIDFKSSPINEGAYT
ncbi:NUDIX domain-containing protein [Ornithinibacillus sp. L9]|uniref:NUDIX domain-containing protein n=1 Tax=Ornithinibacillus caprae TaxID=2678566 RepID=A0A6N8FNE0_9BACI|nr:8-oxo-dGTP diphosphatase [Ornithinibacillus caprae]MUK88888.1 NUDIX domain-containing protein [Ornithinibacillus caprae]